MAEDHPTENDGQVLCPLSDVTENLDRKFARGREALQNRIVSDMDEDMKRLDQVIQTRKNLEQRLHAMTVLLQDPGKELAKDGRFVVDSITRLQSQIDRANENEKELRDHVRKLENELEKCEQSQRKTGRTPVHREASLLMACERQNLARKTKGVTFMECWMDVGGD